VGSEMCIRDRADESVNLAVHASDLVKTGLRDFAGGDFAARELGGKFGNGELVEHRKSCLTQRRKGAERKISL
jgi:hypothetical protein